MAYVEGQTVHDADSHIMELPGTINRYVAPKLREAFIAKTHRGDATTHCSQKAEARHNDPEFRAGAEANILLRKNYEALFGRSGDAAKVSASHVELIFISKALERIGDHSKNIAEQVIFLLSGEDVRHAR